jgi:SAM-dependent methyltransferase
MSNLSTSSLERIVPDQVHTGEVTGDETLTLHLDRYRFATRHLRPGRLLDIACGVGYGTALLAEALGAKGTAIGVDISPEAIDYARQRYASANTRFVNADAMTFADGEGFDTIVSIETIEHLPDPASFVRHIAALLRPAGVLIASVPTTPSVDANPFHLHDFDEASFRRHFANLGLIEMDSFRQIQRFNPAALLGRKEVRSHSLRKNLLAYYFKNPASLGKRLAATLRYGFSNRYLTIVWSAPA